VVIYIYKKEGVCMRVSIFTVVLVWAKLNQLSRRAWRVLPWLLTCCTLHKRAACAAASFLMP